MQLRDYIAGLGDAIRMIRSKIVRAWDGSASNYDDTDAYCSACLIDVNGAAGRDTKAQSHCMLPVKAPGSSGYDFEGIQAAAGGRGVTQVQKPDDVPQDDWDAAVKRAANTIISQYSANDETAPDSVYELAGKDAPESRAVSITALYDAVWMQLYEREGWWYLHDIYEDNGALVAIVSNDAKLYRVAMSVDEDGNVALGEPERVKIEFSPVAARTVVIRQADGSVRWLSTSATAILNRQGQMDSRELFESFVKHAQETGEYPYRTFYHCGENLKTGQCDFLAVDDYCLVTSGTYDLDGPNVDIARAEIRAFEEQSGEWGESIGFLYNPMSQPVIEEVVPGVAIPVFRKGIIVEISTLPEAEAAAIFTKPMEVSRMKNIVKQALEKLGISQERIDELEQHNESVNRGAESGEFIARAAGETEPEEQPAEETPEEEPEVEAVEYEIDEQAIDAVASRFADTMQAIGEAVAAVLERVESVERDVHGAIDALAARIDPLERDDNERVREIREDMPRSGVRRVTYRPSDGAQRQAQEELSSDEQVKSALAGIPGVY